MRIPSISALCLACLALPAQDVSRPAAPSAGDPVSVAIQPFTSAGAPPEFNSLRTMLPNLLQAGLFPYRWITAQIMPDIEPGGQHSSQTSTPQYTIAGRFIQLGDKTRVDITIRSGAQGRIVSTPSATFELSSILNAAQELAVACAGAIGPSAIAATTPREAVATIQSFKAGANTKGNSFLQGTLPRTIQQFVGQSKVVTVRWLQDGEHATNERFQITGEFAKANGKILAAAHIRDGQDPPLSVQVSIEEKLSFTAPTQLAHLVTEVLHGMVDAHPESADLTPHLDDPAACLRAAEFARRQHLPYVAILFYRRAQQAGAKDARLRLVNFYLEQKNVDSAISEIDAFAAEGKSAGLQHLANGLIQFANKAPDDPLKEFRLALDAEHDPMLRAYIYRAMGSTQMAANHPLDAAENFRLAMVSGLDEPELHLAAARAYVTGHDYTRGMEELETAVRKGAVEAGARNEVAAMYRDEGVRLYEERKLTEALPMLRRSIEVRPDDKADLSDSYSHVAHILAFDSKPPQYEEAIPLLQAAMDADPRIEWPCRMLAIIYQSQNKLDQAVETAKAAIRIKASALTYKVLSDIYLDKDEPALAAATLQKSVALGGAEVPDTEVELATAYRTQGLFGLAMQTLNDAKSKAPGNERVRRAMGETLRMMNRNEESARAFRDALDIESTVFAYEGLGETLLEQRAFAPAETAYRAALVKEPNRVNSLFGLAKALAGQGKEADALAAARMATGPDPGPDVSYTDLLEVYRLLGKPEAMRPLLERALKLYPDSDSVLGAWTDLTHEDLFDFAATYAGDKKTFERKPSQFNRSNLAEAAFTSGHYDEAIACATSIVDDGRKALERRLAMRLILTASNLAKKEVSQALLELGKMVDEYKSIEDDWQRNWLYRGFRHYVATTPDLSSGARELLTSLVEALEKNRPESDAIMNRLVQSLDAYSPERLR